MLGGHYVRRTCWVYILQVCACMDHVSNRARFDACREFSQLKLSCGHLTQCVWGGHTPCFALTPTLQPGPVVLTCSLTCCRPDAATSPHRYPDAPGALAMLDSMHAIALAATHSSLVLPMRSV